MSSRLRQHYEWRYPGYEFAVKIWVDSGCVRFGISASERIHPHIGSTVEIASVGALYDTPEEELMGTMVVSVIRDSGVMKNIVCAPSYVTRRVNEARDEFARSSPNLEFIWEWERVQVKGDRDVLKVVVSDVSVARAPEQQSKTDQ
ncbi:MAG: hypothetical protein HQ559_17485 [Lentisphaerae bacterium]|nr:hypothetical protein [Lentisphaerota bacterium]